MRFGTSPFDRECIHAFLMVVHGNRARGHFYHVLRLSLRTLRQRQFPCQAVRLHGFGRLADVWVESLYGNSMTPNPKSVSDPNCKACEHLPLEVSKARVLRALDPTPAAQIAGLWL